MLQGPEKRRNWLAHLKIDGPIFDLHERVVVKFAVELCKVVVGRARSVILEIAPIHVMVVNETSIDEHAAMRGHARAITLAASACVRP